MFLSDFMHTFSLPNYKRNSKELELLILSSIYWEKGSIIVLVKTKGSRFFFKKKRLGTSLRHLRKNRVRRGQRIFKKNSRTLLRTEGCVFPEQQGPSSKYLAQWIKLDLCQDSSSWIFRALGTGETSWKLPGGKNQFHIKDGESEWHQTSHQ